MSQEDRELQADLGKLRQLSKEIEVLDKILRDKRRARDEVKKRLNQRAVRNGGTL
jgi:hypothetical protein